MEIVSRNMGFGLDLERLAEQARCYHDAIPFSHLVINDFFDVETAAALAAEFPGFEEDVWHKYDNAIEIKKTCNDWNKFPVSTYSVFSYLNSPEFVDRLSKILGISPLYPDAGLNGGGWHIHGRGGKLNTHLDYSLHPKLGLQRKLNLIVYMTEDWENGWGGGLGLWSHDAVMSQPGNLVREIAPLFNRAVLFDTTQNSWHGLPSPIDCPDGVFRRSIAVYYLTDPPTDVDTRGKALFAPTETQKTDEDVLELIKRRSAVESAASTYRT